jgi:hypothetical protein
MLQAGPHLHHVDLPSLRAALWTPADPPIPLCSLRFSDYGFGRVPDVVSGVPRFPRPWWRGFVRVLPWTVGGSCPVC